MINDILVEAPATLVPGDDNPARVRLRPGGSAANQAAWLASMGHHVIFAGRVGAADADFHRGALAAFGVEPVLAADDAAATGAIVVLIGPDGERTMITDRGANLRLRHEDVPASLLARADLLHLTGYSFFVPGPRQVALGLIAEARRRGVPFTVDPSSAAFLSALRPGEFVCWTAGAAACFPNRDEAVVLTAVPYGEVADERACPDVPPRPEVMAARLARHYGAVALKLGPEGVVLATGDAAPVRVPAVPAEIRDTTGAGDAFCAGYLSAWLAGASPGAAGRAGAEAAARAVSVFGGRPGLAGRQKDGGYLNGL